MKKDERNSIEIAEIYMECHDTLTPELKAFPQLF